MSATTLLAIILAIVCIGYLTDRILELLTLKRMRPELPDKLKAFYDAERYARSQQYQRERIRFGLLGSTLSFVVSLVVLGSGALGLLDAWLRTMIHNPYGLALAFFGILAVASDLMGMPFALYSTFVIEEKYGFNKMTAKTWVLDKLKGLLIAATLGTAILCLFIWLTILWKEDFWIWFWIGISGLMLLIQFLYTTVVVPIYNKLTPLEDGALRSAIETYSKKVGFPLKNIMVIDGSKRTTKANAFFVGFGALKSIVLYDTLIAQMTQDEILAVLAHEVGHYKRRHIILGTALGVLQIGLMLFVLSRLAFMPELSQALGASVPGIHLSLIAFAVLFSPLSQITGLGMNLLSRKNEYEADAYARETYAAQPLESALIKLHVETLSNLEPHPADVFLHYSHPTMLQRIAALRS
jgi:STE24 endopeptidase